MMKKYQSLVNTLVRTKSAPNTRLLYASAKELSGALGYAHVMMAHAPKAGRTLEESVIYTDSRKHVIRKMDRTLPYDRYLVVTRAKSSRQPFTIKELKAETGNPEVGFGLPEHLKSGDNMLVPVYDENLLVALAMFSGPAGDQSAVARSMLLISTYRLFKSQGVIDNSTRDPKDANYTNREVVCLNYLGRGMDDDEIAKLLGITQRTVRFHIDSIKVKLEAGSRMQAIAKAIQKRLITV